MFCLAPPWFSFFMTAGLLHGTSLGGYVGAWSIVFFSCKAASKRGWEPAMKGSCCVMRSRAIRFLLKLFLWFLRRFLQRVPPNRIVMAAYMICWYMLHGTCVWGGCRSAKQCIFRVKWLEPAMKVSSFARSVWSYVVSSFLVPYGVLHPAVAIRADEVWSVKCEWSVKCKSAVWSVKCDGQGHLVLHCNVSVCVSWSLTKTVYIICLRKACAHRPRWRTAHASSTRLNSKPVRQLPPRLVRILVAKINGSNIYHISFINYKDTHAAHIPSFFWAGQKEFFPVNRLELQQWTCRCSTLNWRWRNKHHRSSAVESFFYFFWGLLHKHVLLTCTGLFIHVRCGY